MSFATRFFAVAVVALTCAPAAHSADPTTRDIRFYSEAVLCAGKLYLPSAYTETAQLPAVILAPGAGATQADMEAQAARLASKGIVAMTIDYRGWGRSGGFLYFDESIRWDDRLRFTQLTHPVTIRRKRIDPAAQITDLRNAMTYLQGEPGIDRARIGIWGVGLSADHAVAVAGSDARVKAFVAQDPTLLGKEAAPRAFTPTAEQQAAMVALARTGKPPTNERAAAAMNATEQKLALAQYFPSWSLESVPATTAAVFIAKSNDQVVRDAAKRLKGPVEFAADGESALSWLVLHL